MLRRSYSSYFSNTEMPNLWQPVHAAILRTILQGFELHHCVLAILATPIAIRQAQAPDGYAAMVKFETLESRSHRL